MPFRSSGWMRRKRRLSGLADEELMELVSEREVRAFEVVYDRHGAAAYSLAHRILGEPRGAEEATQDAFLALWKSGSYDPSRGSVRSWILGVVRNRAIDLLRSHASSRRPPLVSDGGELLAAQPAADRTDEAVIQRETAGALRGALGELPEEQSRVIELAYYGGFSHTEIAEMLQVPLGTVKGRMRLGLERIRGAVPESVR